MGRANRVVKRMHVLGWIDQVTYEIATHESPKVYNDTLTQNLAPFIVDEVIRRTYAIGIDDLKTGGYDIYTSIDIRLQHSAQEAIKHAYEASLKRIEGYIIEDAKLAKKHDWYYLDVDRCATKIMYDWAKENLDFNEPEWMSKYVDIVNAVDLWKKDEHNNFEYGKVCMGLVNETRELNRVMFANEDNAYKLALLKEAVKYISEENAPIVLDEKIHLIKKEFFKHDKNDTLDNLATAYVVELLGAKRPTNTIYYKGYKGFLSYAVGNTSIVGNGFLVAYPEYDFIVDISFKGAMGLRADYKVSVAQIAKEWAGGGGHPNASGGRIQGFKEQYRYDKVKEQIENLINHKESRAGDLEYKTQED